MNSYMQFKKAMIGNGVKHYDWDTPLIRAILSDAFKESATHEEIYDSTGHIIAYESLCHPKDKKGNEYSIFKISQQAYAAGDESSIAFDTFTASLALKKSKESGNIPITINISVASALSTEFFENIDADVKQYRLNPKDIIFEILEHDVERKADISHLHKLKEQGYRFALDDFGKDMTHSNRLHVFADIINFIKIDGPFIRGYIDEYEEEGQYKRGFKTTDESGKTITLKPGDLLRILENISGFFKKRNINHVPLVAERVRNRAEIEKLKPLNFVGFQSFNLDPSKFIIKPDDQEFSLTPQQHRLATKSDKNVLELI